MATTSGARCTPAKPCDAPPRPGSGGGGGGPFPGGGGGGGGPPFFGGGGGGGGMPAPAGPFLGDPGPPAAPAAACARISFSSAVRSFFGRDGDGVAPERGFAFWPALAALAPAPFALPLRPAAAAAAAAARAFTPPPAPLGIAMTLGGGAMPPDGGAGGTRVRDLPPVCPPTAWPPFALVEGPATSRIERSRASFEGGSKPKSRRFCAVDRSSLVIAGPFDAATAPATA